MLFWRVAKGLCVTRDEGLNLYVTHESYLKRNVIREYLNACDAWFISWGMRDSWIIYFKSWKFQTFPDVFPTITDSKRPETCLPMDSLASMAFSSGSVIRTWQVIIFDILRSQSCDSQWHLRSALVVYRCSMENEIESCLQRRTWTSRFLSLSFFASPADQQLRNLV